jgi:ribosomal subunit interface protein
MSLRISGKQMEIGDAFRMRITERIGEAIGKYFGGGFSGRVTMEKNGSRFIADCVISLDSGQMLQATGQAQDPNGAFDAAADRIETRLRRYKRRLKSHAAGPRDGQEDVAYRLVAPLAAGEDDVPEDYAPAIVAESNVSLRRMTVASAVLQLDMTDNPVVVFRNAGNDQVNIVYRRADGNIGWVDPSQPIGKGA